MRLTPPVIAKLADRPARWAQREVRRGHFGEAVWPGNAQFLDLAIVERRLGRQFSPEQIDAAQGRTDGQERR
jgi:hypothetical protein